MCDAHQGPQPMWIGAMVTEKAYERLQRHIWWIKFQSRSTATYRTIQSHDDRHAVGVKPFQVGAESGNRSRGRSQRRFPAQSSTQR